MAQTRTDSGGGLLVELRRDATVALHRQLEASIRDGIRSGRLRIGTVLPATRSLAADLGVSRGGVVEAYQQLLAEGSLTSRTGGHTQVAIDGARAAAPARAAPAPAP